MRSRNLDERIHDRTKSAHLRSAEYARYILPVVGENIAQAVVDYDLGLEPKKLKPFHISNMARYAGFTCGQRLNSNLCSAFAFSQQVTKDLLEGNPPIQIAQGRR